MVDNSSTQPWAAPCSPEGHPMVVADETNSKYGEYRCDQCGNPRAGPRWHCEKSHHDICFSCRPAPGGPPPPGPSAHIVHQDLPGQGVALFSQPETKALVDNSSIQPSAAPCSPDGHLMVVADESNSKYGEYRCDQCGNAQTGPRWHCEKSHHDICFSCRRRVML